MMSIFLMGCVDSAGIWRTVCKVRAARVHLHPTAAQVGNGHDDATLQRINGELDVVKIARDPAKCDTRAAVWTSTPRRVPAWLKINKNDLVPDFVVADAKQAPVWEIIGAEYRQARTGRRHRHATQRIQLALGRRHLDPVPARDQDPRRQGAGPAPAAHAHAAQSWREATSLDELKKLVATSKQHTDVLGVPQLAPNSDEDERVNTDDGAAAAAPPVHHPPHRHRARSARRGAGRKPQAQARMRRHVDMP